MNREIVLDKLEQYLSKYKGDDIRDGNGLSNYMMNVRLAEIKLEG